MFLLPPTEGKLSTVATFSYFVDRPKEARFPVLPNCMSDGQIVLETLSPHKMGMVRNGNFIHLKCNL